MDDDEPEIKISQDKREKENLYEFDEVEIEDNNTEEKTEKISLQKEEDGDTILKTMDEVVDYIQTHGTFIGDNLTLKSLEIFMNLN